MRGPIRLILAVFCVFRRSRPRTTTRENANSRCSRTREPDRNNETSSHTPTHEKYPELHPNFTHPPFCTCLGTGDCAGAHRRLEGPCTAATWATPPPLAQMVLRKAPAKLPNLCALHRDDTTSHAFYFTLMSATSTMRPLCPVFPVGPRSRRQVSLMGPVGPVGPIGPVGPVGPVIRISLVGRMAPTLDNKSSTSRRSHHFEPKQHSRNLFFAVPVKVWLFKSWTSQPECRFK